MFALIQITLLDKMPPKTAADRMRLYRSRMSQQKKEEVLLKNRSQQKASRDKWNSDKLKREKEASKMRMRKTRMNRKIAVLSSVNQEESPTKAFKSPQTFGKAMSKVSAALPSSPRRKVAVVKKLAVKFGFKTKAQRKQLSTDEDLQKSVEEFYKSDTVSRQMHARQKRLCCCQE